MKDEPFSKDEQAELLLKGEWDIAVQKRFPEAWSAAHALQYLTISRSELAAYAQRNPVLVKEYFERVQTSDYSKLHDVNIIWFSDGVFKVAMIDHGTPCGVTTQTSIVKAVAEYIGLVCGLGA